MNRWHVYEFIKQRYMQTGILPHHHELASMFDGIDLNELLEGIYEFGCFINTDGNLFGGYMAKGVGRGKRTAYNELVEDAYICCENYDFRWDRKRYLPEFREMWKEGYSVNEIAKYFKRKPEEVLFLIIDQYSLNEIEQRPGGIWGIAT